MIPTPLNPPVQPGLARFILKSVVVGASPNTFAMQLPEQGGYLLTLIAWEVNRNNSCSQLATCIWSAPLGNSSYMIRKSSMLGSLGTAGSEISALALSDPDTSGVLTVTLTHTHAGSVGAGLTVVASQYAPSSLYANS